MIRVPRPSISHKYWTRTHGWQKITIGIMLMNILGIIISWLQTYWVWTILILDLIIYASYRKYTKIQTQLKFEEMKIQDERKKPN